MTHAPSPKRPPPAPLHERDLYAWSQEQARLLKARRFGEIDADNVAEEILDVGSNEYDKLESALRVLLMHMLKWDCQPERRSSSWEATIRVQRRHALLQIEKNPSLKSRWDEAVARAYDDARDLAHGETDLPLAHFPRSCPYGWDDIVTRRFERD
jgi:hypothetical protein